MLALYGFLTIALLLILIMSKKVSVIVALIAIPIITGLLAGFDNELVGFISDGVKNISTTVVMFVFAILFFGVLMDAGTFEPVIAKTLKLAGSDPVKITLSTAFLAMLVHLDGSGAVTFLIVIPALLPIYDKLGMQRTNLACIVALAAGTMNILPWGGPTIRAASALNIPVTELFNPLLIPVIVGLITVFAIAYMIGKKERKNINWSNQSSSLPIQAKREKDLSVKVGVMIFNYLLIVSSIVIIITALAPPYIVFMVAFVLALVVNFPKVTEQKERADAHAKAALLMASILFAAGCFTGILKGSGMIEAMAQSSVKYIPDFIGSHLAVSTGLLSMPASLLFDPDSYYFGVMPILANTAEHFGGSAIEVGRASIIGQMTTGFPVSPLTGSTYLLIGLSEVDLGTHQKKTIPLAFLVTLVILVVSVLIGTISL